MFFHTASSGISNIPEFVAFGQINGIQGGYCDSSRKVEPTLDWAKKIIEDYPEIKELHAQQCIRFTNSYRVKTENLRKQLNQTDGTLV